MHEKCNLLQASESGEDAKVKGTRKGGRAGKRKKEGRESLPRPLSSQFSPVLFLCSRFLNSAGPTNSEPGWNRLRETRARRPQSFLLLPLIWIISLFSSPRVALWKKDDRPRSNLSYCRKIVMQTCWVSSLLNCFRLISGWLKEQSIYRRIALLREQSIYMRSARFAS